MSEKQSKPKISYEERFKKILHISNIPRHVCSHLMGENHKPGHRMTVGFVVIIVGVGIVKTTGHMDSFIIHYVGDLFGYLIHGAGAVPFVEYYVRK
jgi:hypothetical protein